MKKRVLGFMALLLLVGISTKYVGGTFAKYTSTVSGNGEFIVARWNFVNDNNGNNNGVSITNMSILPTAHATSLVSGRVAPGTEGSFDIALSNATSEVGIEYTIDFTELNTPTNLKFYETRSGSAGAYTYSNQLSTSDPASGTIAAGGSVTKTIYWQWEYETGDDSDEIADNDEFDTSEGYAGGIGNPYTISFDITGTQVVPSANAVSNS